VFGSKENIQPLPTSLTVRNGCDESIRVELFISNDCPHSAGIV
jgi:hypothetical protein